MDYMKLSKEVSFALRHEPWKYELELDENGWVDIDQLIESLRCDRKWKSLDRKDLEIMIEKSDKKRHEIHNSKIRALYGHSTPQKIVKADKIPPDVLYHGTPKYFIESIREKGLIPKSRQYVHLSSDTETAIQVGKRRAENPIILKINAKQASIDGVKFYHANDTIWLVDSIDPKYIIEK
ncbi:RNA 2'-phosphotransferase [Tepidibacter hydrothermalis]|uniref:Probable RNA 2'-phosphotransferase n=1 Tax=Tepidibacter hydrothermalis TaxID=3036126 RepID=A0ABY8EIQ2_9FIRM|nr:RNA 2'-phosphotransferase [Tepidibacter hydrothermalis]WFD11774.1 RNA 2'-phosphotransferase [Tepidibacter hydrothermalis]